jgi:hypothetical protein
MEELGVNRLAPASDLVDPPIRLNGPRLPTSQRAVVSKQVPGRSWRPELSARRGVSRAVSQRGQVRGSRRGRRRQRVHRARAVLDPRGSKQLRFSLGVHGLRPERRVPVSLHVGGPSNRLSRRPALAVHHTGSVRRRARRPRRLDSSRCEMIQRPTAVMFETPASLVADLHRAAALDGVAVTVAGVQGTREVGHQRRFAGGAVEADVGERARGDAARE